MTKTLPPEPYEPPDDVATERTLVEIMRRQRERDRRLLRLATTVAIASLILAFTATFVAWSQHSGWWRMRRSATRSPSVPAAPPPVATRPAPGPSTPAPSPSAPAPNPSAPAESTQPEGPPHVELP